ncbi:MAG: hypothetical protein ABII71_04695 [Candidatus Micrarchaeota archaeon]
MVVVGEKGNVSKARISVLRRARPIPEHSLLLTKFKDHFNPIVSFLNEPNPFDRLDKEKRHLWFTHEYFISRKFALNVMELFPGLKSGDFLLLREFGLSPAVLKKDPSPANVQNVLAGHMSHERSPRWGLMGILILLDQMGKMPEAAPEEHHRAVLEFFRYMRKRVEPYVRACQTLQQTGNARYFDSSNEYLFDPHTGVPLRYLVHMIDGVVLNFAYDPDFDPETFELMSLEWARIPNSMGFNNAPTLFAEADSGSAFGRNVARRLRSLNKAGTMDTVGREWMKAFDIAAPKDADPNGGFPSTQK